MPATGLTALVLAGGESRRFGRDKALLELEGRTLLEHVCTAVGAVADEILVIGRDHMPVELAGVRALPDDSPGFGPMGGLLTGLRAAKHDLIVATACDLPFISVSMLRQLAQLPPNFDAAVPLWKGLPQPLSAVYRRNVLPAIQTQIESGDFRVRRLLDRLQVWWLEESQLGASDADQHCFTNINHPADWQRILQSR